MRVEKLAVFRGLYLGDLVSATGALRALRRGYPEAEISLVSLPWATALAPHLPHVDRLIPYPGAPGLDGGGTAEETEQFLARMRTEHFDLAVNMHGRGPASTRLVSSFGARRTASFFYGTGEEFPLLDVAVSWDAEEHESRKLVVLAERAGGKPNGPEPELLIREEDYHRVQALLRANLRKPLALVHPGASVSEKRWPEKRFGRVAEALVRRGYTVAVTGSADEKELTRRVSRDAPGSRDLGGTTDLSTLIALVGRASIMVSNDTGPAHLAYASNIPSVTLFGPTTDVGRWGPLNQERHTVLRRDPISEIAVRDVLRNVEVLLEEGRERSA